MKRQEILAIAKPILFNTEMVRAILDNKKTVTRRVIKLPRCGCFEHEPPRGVIPPYQVGDILYVRESGMIQSMKAVWRKVKMLFKADDSLIEFDISEKEYNRLSKWAYLQNWLSPYWLTKETSRIFLRVTDIRVERLQDITEEQAKAEGVITNDAVKVSSCRYWFEQLWDSLLPKSKNKFKCPEYSWNANPWVWVIKFERIEVDE